MSDLNIKLSKHFIPVYLTCQGFLLGLLICKRGMISEDIEFNVSKMTFELFEIIDDG